MVSPAATASGGTRAERGAPTPDGRGDDGAPRMRFAFGDDFDPRWNDRYPELAMVANAASLAMPGLEPYVARSVRAGAARLDQDGADQDGPDRDGPDRNGVDRNGVDSLIERAETFVREESAHHREHRNLNRAVIATYPATARVERWALRAYRRLEDRRRESFSLAFAAGSEAVAYAVARWVEKRRAVLLGGAEQQAASLFLWHLAEEVEHKSVAFDVYRASGGGRARYLAAMVCSMIVLALVTFAGTLTMLVADRRIWNPIAHIRLFAWSFSFVFELLPTMWVSSLLRHHPDDFADPLWYSQWLAQYDPETETFPALQT